jgi:hypothetical protein
VARVKRFEIKITGLKIILVTVAVGMTMHEIMPRKWLADARLPNWLSTQPNAGAY